MHYGNASITALTGIKRRAGVRLRDEAPGRTHRWPAALTGWTRVRLMGSTPGPSASLGRGGRHREHAGRDSITRAPADLRRVAAAMRSRRAWRGRCAEMRGAKTPVGPNRGPFPAVSKRLLRPAKNRGFAGYSWMARPGLEPGNTTIFSRWNQHSNRRRNACIYAV